MNHKIATFAATLTMSISMALATPVMADETDTVDTSSPKAFDRSVAQMGSELEGGKRRNFALALTAVSLDNARELSEQMKKLMDNDVSESEIDQAREELFVRAFSDLNGMTADEVITQGRTIASDNDMTLEDMAAMLDSQIIQ